MHQWAEVLINGSGDRILVLDLKPTQRGRVLGFPVRLRQLLVSVDDPEELAKRLPEDSALTLPPLSVIDPTQ